MQNNKFPGTGLKEIAGFKGLLSDEDLLNIDKDAGLERGLAMFAASGPSTTPNNFANVLLSGLQAGRTSQQAGLQQALQQRQLQQQAEDNQNAQQKAQKRQALLSGIGSSNDPNKLQMAFNAAVYDLQDMELAKFFQDQIKSQQFKTQSIQELNVNGKLIKFAIGEDATKRELGVAPDDLIQIDLGGQKALVSKQTGKEIAKFGVSQSPDSKASTGLGYARLNFDQVKEKNDQARASSDLSKAPAGYRYKQDGSLEAIPGGPADQKATLAGQKDMARAEQRKNSALGVLATVREAKDSVSNYTAGFGASLVNIPESKALDLQASLETIKANLGFDELQKMRENSPTGGALGGVAVQELNSLQSTVASLNQKQSPARLKANLEKIEKHYQNWYETTQGKLPGKPGASGDFGAPSTQTGGWKIREVK